MNKPNSVKALACAALLAVAAAGCVEVTVPAASRSAGGEVCAAEEGRVTCNKNCEDNDCADPELHCCWYLCD